jgi:hypothetical protein
LPVPEAFTASVLSTATWLPLPETLTLVQCPVRVMVLFFPLTDKYPA